MPWTWLTFMMGWLAIIGIPPLSGFFSKDPIIEAAFERGDWTSWLFGWAALLGAGLTAFYMTRLFVLTFHGPERYTEQNKHPHESPGIMVAPLVLLAIGSIVAGGLLKYGGFPGWLTPVTGEGGEHAAVMPVWLITTLGLVFAVGGALIAVALFRKGTALEPQPAGAVVTAARRNLYTDAVNEAVFERPGIYLTRALVYLDNKGIDGLVNGIAAGVGGSSGRLRRLQTGFVRSYALSMLTGAVLVVGAFLAIQLGWLA
jgi:NADH-quinone oxidoreductase subunit L